MQYHLLMATLTATDIPGSVYPQSLSTFFRKGLYTAYYPQSSGDHGPGGAADPAEPGERRAQPPELLPVQAAGRGHGGERGAPAAGRGRGPAAARGGRPRDAPQQPETGGPAANSVSMGICLIILIF